MSNDVSPITLKERLQFIHEGSYVLRFHTRPGHTLDTDARHSHGVAILCFLLSPTMPSAELLMAALTHDLGEQAAGDVPAPTKWRMNGEGAALDAFEHSVLAAHGFEFALTEAERRTLKLADALDGMLCCCREAALGNRYVHLIYGKWAAVIMGQELTEREKEVACAVQTIWKESNHPAGLQFDVFK